MHGRPEFLCLLCALKVKSMGFAGNFEEKPAQHRVLPWLTAPSSAGEQRSGCNGSASRAFVAFSFMSLERCNENQRLAA